MVALILYLQSLKRGDYEVDQTNVELTEMRPESYRQQPSTPPPTPTSEPVDAPSDDLRTPSIRSIDELSENVDDSAVQTAGEKTSLGQPVNEPPIEASRVAESGAPDQPYSRPAVE